MSESPQRILLGRMGEPGSGTIRKGATVEIVPARNIADLARRIIADASDSTAKSTTFRSL